MKSNKDENDLLKIEIEAKMKKIKAICCIIFFYIDDIFFVSTEIKKKTIFRNLKYRSMILCILVLTLQYENNSKINLDIVLYCINTQDNNRYNIYTVFDTISSLW